MPAGYLSIEKTGENTYNFQKIYSLPEMHGTGIGRFIIEQGINYLKEVHTALIKLLDEYCKMLQTGTYIQFDYTMVAQEQLLQLVAKATKRQIKRAQRNQTRTRSSLLYLNMLNEMRFMAVQVRALTNDERNFVAA